VYPTKLGMETGGLYDFYTKKTFLHPTKRIWPLEGVENLEENAPAS